MPGLFQTLPFPWHDPAAVELLRTLKGLYFEKAAVRSMLLDLGSRAIDPSFVNFDQALHFVWREVIERSAAEGRLRGLVEQARAEFPTSPAAAVLDKLLQGGVAAVVEPVRPDGSADFKVGDERSSTQEKLLFGDDLTVDVAVLRMVLAVAPAVCRLTVTSQNGSTVGTGFRIGADLVLTAEHVLHGALQVLVEFNYELRPDGLPATPEALAGVTASVLGSVPDDWAVVRLSGVPTGAWPALPLPVALTTQVGDPAIIVQHPSGLHKRVGLVRNRVELVHPQVLHYLTDTRPGSSGAPVFDTSGAVIALHHAGGSVPLPGPAGDQVWKNEGINITRVREGLVAAGVVFDEAGARLPLN